MFNIEIRTAMKRARLFGYEVATALGISESSFSRKLARAELCEEERTKILEVIEALSRGGAVNGRT